MILISTVGLHISCVIYLHGKCILYQSQVCISLQQNDTVQKFFGTSIHSESFSLLSSEKRCRYFNEIVTQFHLPLSWQKYARGALFVAE